MEKIKRLSNRLFFLANKYLVALMLELFELSRFFSGSEFLQQENGLLKKPKPFAPNLKF